MLVPYSRIKAEIARILKQEGYITDYEVDTEGRASANQGHEQTRQPHPCHHRPEAREPARACAVMSAPGNSARARRHGHLPFFPRREALLTGRQAKKQNVGGELLAYVW